MKRVLFIDRDGTLVVEPPVDYQLDSFGKLEFVPKAIGSMSRIATLGFELVMATNQDGLGTESFPEETFWPVQNLIIKTLEGEGVHFDDVLIDRTLPEQNAPTRKPGTGMFGRYLAGGYDLKGSYVIGDRLTDVELARNLGIEYNVIPISEIYTSVVNTLKPVIGGREFDATEENIQTRIRTVLLMAVQNKADYILLNSSNKSENALGLCTLYGDTAGAFSPTGDLYKSEMYDLARYINRTQGDPIPGNILDKEPSSELHPGQKDSDILPPYEVVDAILYRMIEEGQHREEIVNAGFDSEVVEKIHAMIMRNEKKRYQFPPVLRLSMCSFGHERLMPLTNKYGD